MRILIAGLLGAIAMFVWTAIAHMATPLAYTGISKMANEKAVLAAMTTDNVGAKPGLYFYPWIDPKDSKGMEKYAALAKVNPTGMLLYHPLGQSMGDDMTPMMIKEFLKQLAQALIAAWIASMIAMGFVTRAAAVTAIGFSAGIATNMSYWNWYGFPLDYTLAQVTIELVSGIVAGLAIAWWLGRGAKA